MRKEIILGVYAIINKINRKCYIGSSSNIYGRWSSHLSELKNNKHKNQKLQRAWNKYGENNFVFEMLEIFSDKQMDKLEFRKILIKREQYYLNLILFANENNDIFKNLGYNISRTARNSYGIKRNKTKEYKRETKSVYQYDLNGKFLKEWNGLIFAANFYNLSISGISNCCNKRIKTSGGFVWRLKKDIKNKNIKIKKSEFDHICYNQILQYDSNGLFLKEWKNAKEIKRTLGINSAQIGQVCIGNKKSSGGFYWIHKSSDKIKNKIKIPQPKRTNKVIIQYDINGKKIKEWKSIILASRTLGISKTTVIKSCAGHKIREKYFFKYKNNLNE